ncbi:MAG: GTPase HflX [Bacteroidota bacterium]
MERRRITSVPRQETAVLVALLTPHRSRQQAQEHLDELALLAYTLGIQTLAQFTQHLEKPRVRTLIGEGKLAEIDTFVKMHQVDHVIFDDELTPSQTRNVEAALGCSVLDRNRIILNIFAMRAKTKQAKTQVMLAQYEYLLPRLTKMWSHLSRQKGGNPGMRGPGEKELETDRRIVKEKIGLLRSQLAAIDRQSIIQRKQRKNFVRVSLVGYTNVGKSTLMRLLSKAEVQVEDRLFATIGSTVRRAVVHDIPYLLTDTVGFIRKLPHTLIACFRSTLNEVREADILLHVVDISHPACEEHIGIVQETLQEIGAVSLPTLLVFNKIDRLQPEGDEQTPNVAHLQQSYFRQYGHTSVCISAQRQEHIAELKALLYQHVRAVYQQIYPHGVENTVPDVVL